MPSFLSPSGFVRRRDNNNNNNNNNNNSNNNNDDDDNNINSWSTNGNKCISGSTIANISNSIIIGTGVGIGNSDSNSNGHDNMTGNSRNWPRGVMASTLGSESSERESKQVEALGNSQPIFGRPPGANCGSSADASGWPVGPTLWPAAC